MDSIQKPTLRTAQKSSGEGEREQWENGVATVMGKRGNERKKKRRGRIEPRMTSRDLGGDKSIIRPINDLSDFHQRYIYEVNLPLSGMPLSEQGAPHAERSGRTNVPFPSTPNGSTHPEKLSAHECGSDPSGDARSRSDTRSHPVPTSSIISDPEVTSSSPWAVPPNKIDSSGVTTNDRETIGGEGQRVERAMPTSNQSICHGREKKQRTNRTQASNKCLRSKEYARVFRREYRKNLIQLHEHPMVLIKGGRVKDLPGAKFHHIRGVKDSLGTPGRRRGRSKHGAKRPKSIRMKDVFSPKCDVFGPFFSTQSGGGPPGKVIRVLPFGIVPDRPPLSTLLRYRPRRTENEDGQKQLHDRELAEKDGQKQSHNINSSAGEGGGPLSSKPRGRRAGTYNCSEILSYTGGLDGGQKQLINKLVNFRTINGERTRARAIAHQTFHRSAQTERDVTKLLVNVVENINPIAKWIGSDKCSSAEIPDAYRKRGIARKKRDDPHEPAPTNRSFAHLRWW
eukprot:Gb_04094 [translate_table: standard]